MKGFVTPKPVVVSPRALVPRAAVIRPAPTEFSHELVRRAPYVFAGSSRRGEPHGHLSKGTKVVLLGRGRGRCRVVDRRGLHVEVACDSLRRLR